MDATEYRCTVDVIPLSTTCGGQWPRLTAVTVGWLPNFDHRSSFQRVSEVFAAGTSRGAAIAHVQGTAPKKLTPNARPWSPQIHGRRHYCRQDRPDRGAYEATTAWNSLAGVALIALPWVGRSRTVLYDDHGFYMPSGCLDRCSVWTAPTCVPCAASGLCAVAGMRGSVLKPHCRYSARSVMHLLAQATCCLNR